MNDPANPLVSDVLALAQDALLDATGVRWDEPTLLVYVQDALRALCILNPSAHMVTESIQLDPGTIQDIPADANQEVTIHRNMGTDGNTPGKVVYHTTKDDLDRFNPDWHMLPPATEIEEFCYNEDNPDVFWVKPPVTASQQVWVEASFGKTPPAITLAADPLPVKAIYITPLSHYVCYRALNREDEIGVKQYADGYLTAFGASLGIKIESDKQLYQRTKERQP